MTNDYVYNFVTGYNIKFETNKKNKEANEKSLTKWEQIKTELNINSDSIIIFCGAKNNGKSSLVRYIVNNYLSDNEQNQEESFVYYVDLDPGQPEMSTPGVVSCHIIEKSLQSPTYMNVRENKTLVMSSVGGINVSVNPHAYIRNSRKIIETVRLHRRTASIKQPIFVNTMGFIRNVGLALLMDVIKLVRPTDLVILNVDGDPMRTVYADLTPESMTNTRPSFYYEVPEESKKRLNYRHHLHNLDFAFVDSASVATRNRNALQLAYLSQIPEALYKPIMEITPRTLSMEYVSFYCVSSYPLKSEIVLELLNNSWVHLVKIKLHTSKPTDQLSQTVKTIDDVDENDMFGCGIIKHIDLESRNLLIITPLSQDELKNINCVIKPLSIQVPF